MFRPRILVLSFSMSDRALLTWRLEGILDVCSSVGVSERGRGV